MLLLAATLAHAAVPGTVVATVSPKGPVKSLAAAQQLVRAALLKGQPGPLRVVIRGGTYTLTEPLRFDPRDSGTAACPVVYEAAPGERPVFSGGRAITGWRKGEGQLWVVDVPAVKDGSWYFKQLFVNGQRGMRARTPNEGYLRVAKPFTPAPGVDRNSDPNCHLGFIYSGTDLQNWPDLADANMLVYHAWTSSRH
jgi:hypothetical protein